MITGLDPSRKKSGRLPDSAWHTVNRPTREMGTGVLPGPTRADCGNSLLRAGAPKAFNFFQAGGAVKS